MLFSIDGEKQKYDTHLSVQPIIDRITPNINEIIEINLNNNVFSEQAAIPLFQIINKCKSLKKLSISRIFSALPLSEMMLAFKAVITNIDPSKLLYLDISENALSCNLPSFFKKFMSQLNNLKVLKMNNCGFGQIGGHELAQILESITNKKNLMVIDLSSNNLIKSASVLGDSLKCFSYLEEVYMQYNNIDRDSMYKFLQALEDLSLVKIDLRDNLIDERGCKILGDYFVCWDLEYLRIGDCLIGDSGLKAFINNACVRSKYIMQQGSYDFDRSMTLDISYNEISYDGFKLLEKFVETFKINKLCVEGNCVEEWDKLTEIVHKYGGEFIFEDEDSEEEDDIDSIEEKIANL